MSARVVLGAVVEQWNLPLILQEVIAEGQAIPQQQQQEMRRTVAAGGTTGA
jgi:hypothetical protein